MDPNTQLSLSKGEMAGSMILVAIERLRHVAEISEKSSPGHVEKDQDTCVLDDVTAPLVRART